MFTVDWAISQILSYEPWWWLAFIAIAAGLSYRLKVAGIFMSQFLVGLLVCVLDVNYQSTHAAHMDFDIVFELGVFARIVLINTVLLPVTIGCAVRRHQLDRARAA